MTERELLAQGIRRAILRSGKSEADIARRLNWGASTVYKWCRGDSRPAPKNLDRLCTYLDVDAEDVRAGYPDFADGS
ncbi:helix-turn-helix domain-containing protein [Pseudonocardia sp. RS010]|uniref:helix-turn-helix domain-containing protein n=1 Tax=Pseudonocardia sp. RS010 TaxID=3385979 RepID=UPI0039A2782C